MSTLKKVLRHLFNAGIIGFLFYQIYEIGFARVVRELPLNPLFYLLFIINYLSLPVSEYFIYRVQWHLRFKEAFLLFVKKKVLNTDVLGYSGELYLFYEMKKTLKRDAVEIFNFIKDNNIISSVASTLISIILLTFFLTSGYLSIFDLIGKDNLIYLVLGVIVLGGVGVLVYYFRSYVFHLDIKNASKIFSIYTSRLLFTNFIQILQWAIIKPEIPITVWFSLMAVQVISSRIPLLPSRDVLFVNIALGISPMVDVAQADLVGILTANLIMKKLISFLSFSLTTSLKTAGNYKLEENYEVGKALD